jgi:hypothetical protein
MYNKNKKKKKEQKEADLKRKQEERRSASTPVLSNMSASSTTNENSTESLTIAKGPGPAPKRDYWKILTVFLAIVAVTTFYLNFCTKKVPAIVYTRPQEESGVVRMPRVNPPAIESASDSSSEFSKTIFKSNPISNDTTRPIKGVIIKRLVTPNFPKDGMIRFQVGDDKFNIPLSRILQSRNLFDFSLTQVGCQPPIFIGIADQRLYLSTDFYDGAEPHEKVGTLSFSHWDVVVEKIYPKIESSDTSLLIRDKGGAKMFSVVSEDFSINDCDVSIEGYFVSPQRRQISFSTPSGSIMCIPYSDKNKIDDGLARLAKQ